MKAWCLAHHEQASLKASCTCRSTISAKQAEAEAAGAAVTDAAHREQAVAKAVEDAARRMAELQAELEQLKQDERREQLRIQVLMPTMVWLS